MKRMIVLLATLPAAHVATAGDVHRCASPDEVSYDVGALSVDAPRDGDDQTYVAVTGWLTAPYTFDCRNTPLNPGDAVMAGYTPGGENVDIVFEGSAYRGVPLTADKRVVAIYQLKYPTAGGGETMVNLTKVWDTRQFVVGAPADDFTGRIYTNPMRVRVLARADLAVGRHSLIGREWTAHFIGSMLAPVTPAGSIYLVSTRVSLIGSVTKTAATCTSTVPGSVTLDPVKQAEFASDGSRVPGQKVFVIRLHCPSTRLGMRVRATMTDANDPANRTNRLTNSGDATGAHLRIMTREGADVIFGPDTPVVTPQQFDLANVPAAGNPDLPIELMVGYGNTPGAWPGHGTVAGTATITFSYQ